MAYYGVIYPEFWTGSTGRQLRAHGRDVQLLALYLMSSPHSNMLGLYHLPTMYIRQESGLSAKAIVSACDALQAEQFAFYDAGTEHVWVREMARFRMSLGPDRPKLDKDDNKVKAARRMYEALPANPWLAPFFDRYAKALHLRSQREGPLQVGLRRGLEGASKPVNRSVSVTGSVTDKSTGDFAPGFPQPVEKSEPSHGLLCVLVEEEYQLHPALDHDSKIENIKVRCARLNLHYSTETIWKALDAVDAAKAKRKRHA